LPEPQFVIALLRFLKMLGNALPNFLGYRVQAQLWAVFRFILSSVYMVITAQEFLPQSV
jgi:hypothetical protein